MTNDELLKSIALRRAALFNIKVKNQGKKDYFNKDYDRIKELKNERERLAIILKTKIGIENVDDYLVKIENENYYNNNN